MSRLGSLAASLPLAPLRLASISTALLLPIIAIAAYSFAITPDPSPVDYSYFGSAGAAILRGQFGEVYSLPAVQAGPLELLCFAPAYLLGVSSVTGWFVYYVLLIAVLTWFVVFATLIVIGEAVARPIWAGLAAGAVACLSWLVPGAAIGGHPAQVVVPLLWVLAAHLAHRGRFAAVGVAIGFSAGWEVWGLLGVPVILLALRPRLVPAALAGVLTLAVLYLPFVLTGSFRMFEFHWPIREATLVHGLWPGLEEFPWSLRLAQSAVVLAVGCVIALLSRANPSGFWLVPLALVLARLVTDPTLSGYYWLAAEVLVLGLAACLFATARWWLAAVAAAVLVALWAYTTKGLVAAVVLLLAVICTAVVLAVQRRDSGRLVLSDAV